MDALLSRERAVNSLLRELLGPAGRARPHDHYQRLAELGPVAVSGAGWVVVSGYEECRRVLAEPSFVTTGHARKTAAGAVVESGFTSTMLASDGATHLGPRRGMAGDFTARAVAGMRPVVREAAAKACAELAEALDRTGVADLMEHVAEPVPSAVIGGWSHAPESDWPMLRRLAADAHLLMEMGLRASQVRAALESFIALRGYFADLTRGSQERRAHLWPWSRGLPEDLLTANLALVSAAGTVTTSGLIGTTVRELGERPRLWERLATGEPALGESVALEANRFDGPAQLTCRVAERDTELGGVPVRAGAPVVLLLGAANRDARIGRMPSGSTRTAAAPTERWASATAGIAAWGYRWRLCRWRRCWPPWWHGSAGSRWWSTDRGRCCRPGDRNR